jgi:biotin operon repressor
MAIHRAVQETRARKPRNKKRGPDVHRNGRGAHSWSLLSPQGRVLFYFAACPDSPVDDVARNLGLTERAVWGVVRDLRRHGMIRLRKRGRRHLYAVNLDAPLLHPTIRGLTLRPILGKVASKARRGRPEACD